MNTSYIATAVTLRDLNCYSLKTIENRILLQKKIYLAQKKGLPLGYGYSWYIHGPYSPDLTAVAYQVIPEGREAIEGMKLNDPYAGMVQQVNEIEHAADLKELKIGVVPWYELIASIAYWKERGYAAEEAIVQKLRETKPQFSEEQVRRASQVYAAFEEQEA